MGLNSPWEIFAQIRFAEPVAPGRGFAPTLSSRFRSNAPHPRCGVFIGTGWRQRPRLRSTRNKNASVMAPTQARINNHYPRPDSATEIEQRRYRSPWGRRKCRLTHSPVSDLENRRWPENGGGLWRLGEVTRLPRSWPPSRFRVARCWRNVRNPVARFRFVTGTTAHSKTEHKNKETRQNHRAGISWLVFHKK